MLSYQHGYHAGNFADVIKHLVLTRLLIYLTKKDKSLLYLETHAGRGLYSLQDKQSQKTKEYQQGIELIWPYQKKLPELFQPYLEIIGQLNHEQLDTYPGSPYFALSLLRKNDRLYCCELHPEEYLHLIKMSRLGKKIHFSHIDGLSAMSALLPPPEKRGLIFIDPSFELKQEYKDIPLALKKAVHRFATGTFCLWYPIVNRRLTDQLVRGMGTISQESLRVEFNLNPLPAQGMTGCGLWIINPPFILAQEIKMIFETLKTYFNPGFSSYFIDYLE